VSNNLTIANQEVDVSADNQVTLKLTIAQASVRDVYRRALADIGRTAQVKGFRRGKVPADVVERKFGDSVRAEASQQLVQASFEQALEEIEQKPMQIAAPHVHADDDLDLDADFTFSIHYDTFPDVTLGEYRGLTLEEPQVAPGEEDVGRELEGLQQQNAIVVEKVAGDGTVVATEVGDVITVDFVEQAVAGATDAGLGEADAGGSSALAAHAAANRPGAERRDFVFEVGTGYNAYAIDDDVVGMQLGDTKVVTKDYAEDYQYPELAGRTVNVEVTLKALKSKQLPEIDDEFAQDVSDRFQTLADLKSDIETRLAENAKRLVRERVISGLLDQVGAAATIALPKSMVDAELGGEWQELVARAGGDESRATQLLEREGQSVDALLEEWRPRVERRVRLMLVVDKMAEEEKLEVSDADVEAELTRRAEARNTDLATLKQQYEQANMLRMLKNDVRNERLYDSLLESATLKKGKKVKYLDLVQGND
jgi:trigger factor